MTKPCIGLKKDLAEARDRLTYRGEIVIEYLLALGFP
jgi:hypothetical protein